MNIVKKYFVWSGFLTNNALWFKSYYKQTNNNKLYIINQLKVMTATYLTSPVRFVITTKYVMLQRKDLNIPVNVQQ